MTIEERFEMLRKLTLEAFGDAARKPFQRDVERVIKLQDDKGSTNLL
jgi:hypothetical protein